jgi:hypothetical protein
MSNSGIGPVGQPLLTPEVARTRNVLALKRREQFAASHPEIDIRAMRVASGRMVFEVREPELQVVWIDQTAMMNDFKARYPR